MNRLELREEAERDVFDAAIWYEEEREGLGFRFEAEASRVLDLIAENPLAFAVIEKGVRRALLRTFPYGVFFLFEDGVVTVLGVLHLHRHPDAWRRRT